MSIDSQITKQNVVYIYTVECCSAIKWNEDVLTQAITRLNLGIILLNERR